MDRSQFFLFESTDLVKRGFAERHGRDLNLAKAREIVSHIAQAREYFSSAASSSDLVRPLLQYYGATALARAVVLFASPVLRESGLSRGHGLGAREWHNRLSHGLDQIPELAVTVQRGTFLQLCQATQNAEWLKDADTNPLFPSFVPVVGSTELPVGLTFTIRDIVARIPDLWRTYLGVFNESPLCYPCRYKGLGADRTRIDLLKFAGHLPEPRAIQRQFRLPADTRFAPSPGQALPLMDLRPYISFDWQPTENSQYPPIKYDANRNDYLVAPLGGHELSTLSLLFCASYCMGILVRYYPTQWAALMARSVGDKLLPLVIKLTDVIQDRLPELAFEELEAGF